MLISRIRRKKTCYGLDTNFSRRAGISEKLSSMDIHRPRKLELRSNRINIDTGAFATGRLTCLVIEGETLSVIDTVPNQKNCQR